MYGQVRKYVLIVDGEGGPLSAMVNLLRDFGFRTLLVPDADTALQFAAAFPKLGLLAVGPRCDQARLAQRLRDMPGRLPVVWVTDSGLYVSGGRPHEAYVGEVTPEVLRRYAAEVLCESFYPPELVAALLSSCERALAGFDAYSAASDPFLRSSQCQLGELSSVIAFSGRDVSGHLVVSSSEQVARAASRRVAPEAYESPSPSDTLGELCNRIIGSLQPFFGERGLPFTFGIPLHLAGHAVLWTQAARPSVGLEFEGLSGAICIELSVDAFEPNLTWSRPPEAYVEPGNFILL